MSTFSDRAFSALAQFSGRLSAFTEALRVTGSDPSRLSRETLRDLQKTADRARSASDAIGRSLTLIDITALDIVDMQVRLQGETAKLASALRDLGKMVEERPSVQAAFGDVLIGLDEAAQMVAAALFPGAVQGLREVNVKLWDFQKIQWMRYTNLLTEVVQRGTISPEQQERIQAIADDVEAAFEEVNTLLNDLAEGRPRDAAALRRRLDDAPARLHEALNKAKTKLEQSESKTLDVFGSVIKASIDVAEDVATLLRKLTIPVFPTHAGLGPCCDFVAPTLYDSLSGVQLFALLNILARFQATTASGRPLLTNRNVTVTHVFPDRIYMEADRSIISDLEADEAFEQAPASLHRFKEGSFKQRTYEKGNLQVTFASRPNNRVVIDADMDLYRGVIPHLFGEVLVNHLTGSTTDQFKVRRILDAQNVSPIEGFELLTP